MEELGGWLTHFPERPDTGMLLELCPAAIVGDDPVVDSCHPNCFAVMLRER
jgi:hypothetical protein